MSRNVDDPALNSIQTRRRNPSNRSGIVDTLEDCAALGVRGSYYRLRDRWSWGKARRGH